MSHPSDNNATVEKQTAPEAGLGLAFYPGKQAWKAEPGSRYSPEELREMDRN